MLLSTPLVKVSKELASDITSAARAEMVKIGKRRSASALPKNKLVYNMYD